MAPEVTEVIRLDEPTGEALFAGDGANYKSSAPAGQAGKGHCRWLQQDKPARGLCIAVL